MPQTALKFASPFNLALLKLAPRSNVDCLSTTEPRNGVPAHSIGWNKAKRGNCVHPNTAMAENWARWNQTPLNQASPKFAAEPWFIKVEPHHALSRTKRGLAGFLIVDGPLNDEIMKIMHRGGMSKQGAAPP